MHLPLRRYWNLLARYMKPHMTMLVALGLLLLLGIGLRLAAPQFAKSFIDAATAGGTLNTLLVFAAGESPAAL